jgi:hypothetical protein
LSFLKLILTDASRISTSSSCLKHHAHWAGKCISVLSGHPGPAGYSRPVGPGLTSELSVHEPCLDTSNSTSTSPCTLCSDQTAQLTHFHKVLVLVSVAQILLFPCLRGLWSLWKCQWPPVFKNQPTLPSPFAKFLISLHQYYFFSVLAHLWQL